MKYCESIYEYRRRKTREVFVGNVGFGAHHPVRIQSMTTTNTRDVDATVEQVLRLAEAGCEMVRVTVQGMKEAEACEAIKSRLIQKGCEIPLVADIHFYPPAALRVVDFVEKVRINPGNFVDKRASFKTIEYTSDAYERELERIEEKFIPLVDKCKRLKRAMRIGTNHGSLSDRIMNRYGDTPQGMLESALEFARICRKSEYHDFFFSMKASNPFVMIQAYRLLSAKMFELDWDYPLHLGVTEAGEGEDGRVKSAIGIGALLLDGLGDTIRVSLTEDPWNEIEPCRQLIDFTKRSEHSRVTPFNEKYRDISTYQRRLISMPPQLHLNRLGSVILGPLDERQELSKLDTESREKLPYPEGIYTLDNAVTIEDKSCDVYFKPQGMNPFLHVSNKGIPVLGVNEAKNYVREWRDTLRFSLMTQQLPPFALDIEENSQEAIALIEEVRPSVIFLSPRNCKVHTCRQFFEWIREKNIAIPVILHFRYDADFKDLVIAASAEYGALLCDGLGDGVWIEAHESPSVLRHLSFNILQAARMRIFKTDFISCPSCGRTLFDLQEVSRRIREKTAHLPGVKIAIMGCIVNGPGEMADADFGYVGSKVGKIDLYVGKECVERDICSKDADDRLIELIKRHGRWIDAV